jgi:hypothetical protein
MDQTRRSALALLFGSTLVAGQAPDVLDEPQSPGHRKTPFPDSDADVKLPNGKSQKDAIAEQQHAQALKSAEQLIGLAQELKSELEKAGNFVVPVSTIKKTEDIEKLARKIRGKLKS